MSRRHGASRLATWLTGAASPALRHGASRLVTWLIAASVALVLAGCTSAGHSTATPPPSVPGEATQGPDLSNVQLPNFVMPVSTGRVSRPRSALTPGAVTTTDANVVCNTPTHTRAPSIPIATQTAVFAAYGYTTPASQHKYTLDYLIPYNLGGAPTQANIWPAAVRGTGFSQKAQTDYILHQLVCRRTISLALAQDSLKADWYAAWLRYVVAGGHL